MTQSSLTGKTILVTGGAGFIGSHLVDAIIADNTVRVIDDLSTGSHSHIPEKIQFCNADIQDEAALGQAMSDVDIVFHQAALVSVEQSIAEPTRSHAINVTATQSLLEHARRENARVVYASSAAIYGTPRTVPIAESDPKKPESPYGLGKLTADHYCQLYASLYDVEAVSLRYFNVYGPRQPGGQYSGVIESFLGQALAGEPITVHGDGTQTRDFVHVDDVVRANLAAATTEHTGQAFNIATGDSISIRGLADLIQTVVDTSSTITHTDPRPGDIPQSRADISKAQEKLGYKPSISLQDGLASVRDWHNTTRH